MILNKQIKDWSIDSKLKLEAKKRAYTYIKLLFQLILFRIRKGGKESYIYIYIYIVIQIPKTNNSLKNFMEHF